MRSGALKADRHPRVLAMVHLSNPRVLCMVLTTDRHRRPPKSMTKRIPAYSNVFIRYVCGYMSWPVAAFIDGNIVKIYNAQRGTEGHEHPKVLGYGRPKHPGVLCMVLTVDRYRRPPNTIPKRIPAYSNVVIRYVCGYMTWPVAAFIDGNMVIDIQCAAGH